MGCNHFVVEDGRNYCTDGRTEESTGFLEEIEATSPPDRLMSEIYKYFANWTCPSGDRAMRRQRKKERGRFGRQHYLESEHFVKINHYYPTSDRPLQGLWKVFFLLPSLCVKVFIFILDWAIMRSLFATRNYAYNVGIILLVNTFAWYYNFDD